MPRDDDWDDDDLDEYPDDEELAAADVDTLHCPHCDELIYDDTPRCPACGEYLTAEDYPGLRHQLWYALGVFLCLVLAVLMALGWQLGW